MAVFGWGLVPCSHVEEDVLECMLVIVGVEAWGYCECNRMVVLV